MSLLDDLKEDELGKAPAEEELPSIEPKTLKLQCKGDTERYITSGISTDYNLVLSYTGPGPDRVRVSVDDITKASLGEEAAEWIIEVHRKDEKPWEISRTGESKREYDIEPGEPLELTLRVLSPKGARYGDRSTVVVTATLVSDPALNSTVQAVTTARQSVLAVKTQIGHERAVADTLAARAKNIGVLSIICPAPLRGYVLVEAMNTDRLEEVVRGIRRARGMVKGEMKINEIEHYLTPKPLVSGIVEGDIVELVAGPFKGEKARVQHIDESKEEITVELFEALVPIPVTVKGDSVRVIETEK